MKTHPSTAEFRFIGFRVFVSLSKIESDLITGGKGWNKVISPSRCVVRC